MAEGWLRFCAEKAGLDIEVHSAGTVASRVKPDAITVMREVSIDLGSHYSKALDDLPDPWNFDIVLTVCDSANEACPIYPLQTTRLHLAFPDPSGADSLRWREVRDDIGKMSCALIRLLKEGGTPNEVSLQLSG